MGECPQGALTVIEREADEFDEEAWLALNAEFSNTRTEAALIGLQAKYSSISVLSEELSLGGG